VLKSQKLLNSDDFQEITKGSTKTKNEDKYILNDGEEVKGEQETRKIKKQKNQKLKATEVGGT